MHSIEFRINPDTWRGRVVDLYIDDRNLIETVGDFERQIGPVSTSDAPHGGYIGLPPEDVLPPSRHFLGEPPPIYDEDGKVTLFACSDCGDPGCWPLLACIEVQPDTITWRDFEQPHRRGIWSYAGFGPFIFQRAQYEAALSQLKEA